MSIIVHTIAETITLTMLNTYRCNLDTSFVKNHAILVNIGGIKRCIAELITQARFSPVCDTNVYVWLEPYF